MKTYKIKTDRKNKKKEFYINTAAEVFAKYGYRKTTLEDISFAAGKTKTGIYYYFKNKESIFKAVVENEIDIIKEETLVLLNNNISPLNKIKEYIFLRYKHLSELSNFYEALKNDFLDGLSFINEVRSKYNALELTIFENILIDGNKTGVFNIHEPQKTAKALSTVLQGLEIPFFIQDFSNKMEESLEELLNLLCYGIVTRKQ
jgi:AcrR family transcriptional regulator